MGTCYAVSSRRRTTHSQVFPIIYYNTVKRTTSAQYWKCVDITVGSNKGVLATNCSYTYTTVHRPRRSVIGMVKISSQHNIRASPVLPLQEKKEQYKLTSLRPHLDSKVSILHHTQWHLGKIGSIDLLVITSNPGSISIILQRYLCERVFIVVVVKP